MQGRKYKLGGRPVDSPSRTLPTENVMDMVVNLEYLLGKLLSGLQPLWAFPSTAHAQAALCVCLHSFS